MGRILVVTVLFSLALAGPPVIAAQEASPVTGQCTAPDLPPATLTTPASSPVMEEGTTATGMSEPTPTPVGTPADPGMVARVVAAEENLNACFNVGDDRAVVALFTPNKRMQVFGTPDPYAALAVKEAEGDLPPFELLAAENVQLLPDGRIRVEIRLRIGEDLYHEADYWIERDGVLLLDWTETLPTGAGTPAADMATP